MTGHPTMRVILARSVRYRPVPRLVALDMPWDAGFVRALDASGTQAMPWPPWTPGSRRLPRESCS